jgi:NTP pyrophosphatase (non-canonical NTP hydrolase)
MRDVRELLNHGMNAASERLNDPKNVEKGDFPINVMTSFFMFTEEAEELKIEVQVGKDYARIREEIGDCIAILSMMAKACDNHIEKASGK